MFDLDQHCSLQSSKHWHEQCSTVTKQEGAVATRLARLGHVIVYRFGVWPNAPDQLQSLTHLKSQPPYLIAERQLLSVSCAFFEEMRNKRFVCVLSKIPFSCAFLLWCILGFITTVMQWQYVWSVFHGLCKTCTFYFVEKLQRSTLSLWLDHASWSLLLVACGPLNWPAVTYSQILHSPDVQHQPQARKHTGPSDSCLVTANDIRPHPSCQKVVPFHWWI